jgi:hypothetical protein
MDAPHGCSRMAAAYELVFAPLYQVEDGSENSELHPGGADWRGDGVQNVAGRSRELRGWFGGGMGRRAYRSGKGRIS